jgi:nucleotide-binding universal stress UspA family protein
MTRTHDTPASAAVQPLTARSSNIVVATDATTDADGAVRVGFALAKRDGVYADVFSVVEPLPLFEPDGSPSPDAEQLVIIATDARRTALLAQRDRTHPGMQQWPFTVDVGARVETIVERAERRDASLILLGLGAHGVAARLSGRETALGVIRAAHKPVLAVPSDAWGVPHSALAAMDFTASSEHAARVAVDLLGGEGTLYLAHVTPRVPIPQGDPRTWGEITTSAVVPKLEAIARHLGASPAIRVEYVLLHGDPARELLSFADQLDIDLIAAGTHGRSAFGRLMLGSVSTKLIRLARRMVMVAPPRPGMALADGEVPPNDWR